MIFSFFSILLLSTTSFASAPAQQAIELKPAIVTWDKDLRPLFIGLEGKETAQVGRRQKIEIQRKKFPTTKLHLVYISKKDSLAPLKVPIPDTETRIHITKNQLKKIKPNELWLWGQTPKSHCRGFSSLHIRFLNKKSVYQNQTGLFAWKLLKSDLPTQPVLYISSMLNIDTPQKVTSPALLLASKNSHVQCQLHHGGPCPFVFNLDPKGFGKRHRVDFKRAEKPVHSAGNCPV